MSGLSRGFGFVGFNQKEVCFVRFLKILTLFFKDSQNAISEMNGVNLLGRTIRVNWAHQHFDEKSNLNRSQTFKTLSLEYILNSSSSTNSTVYVGNLASDVLEKTIYDLFRAYGEIDQVKIQSEKGFGFVIFNSHEEAAKAIQALSGFSLGSKQIKCHWGKEKVEIAPIYNASGMYLPGNPYTSQVPYPQYPPYAFQYPPGMIYPFNPAGNIIETAWPLQWQEKTQYMSTPPTFSSPNEF